MSVTPEDRIAAASVAVLPEMRELILAGKADHHAEPWAACREKAFLAGAKAMQEAAAKVAWLAQPLPDVPVEGQHQSAFTYGAHSAYVAIRALSPPTILKEQGDGGKG